MLVTAWNHPQLHNILLDEIVIFDKEMGNNKRKLQDMTCGVLDVIKAEREVFGDKEGLVDYRTMHDSLKLYTNIVGNFVKKYPKLQKKIGGSTEKMRESLTMESEKSMEAIRIWGEIAQNNSEFAQRIKKIYACV